MYMEFFNALKFSKFFTDEFIQFTDIQKILAFYFSKMKTGPV